LAPLSFKRHRFPPDVIRHAIWLYFRFTLSFRDVEEMLAERGIDLSYETVRCWAIKFGPQIAMNLRRKRPAPSSRWHLDEMLSTIGGEPVWIWRAVDDESEVLDPVVQKRRDTAVALKLLKRLLRNQPVEPEDDCDRWPQILQIGAEGTRAPRTSPTRPLAREQSSRERAPPDSTARTQDATLQIASFGPEVPHRPRGALQHILRTASSRQSILSSPLSSQSCRRLG